MTERTALQTAAAVRAGETTALAEAEAAIARIEARDGALNAVVVRDFDRARDAARALDARIAAGFDAPLLGVPMTIKESYDVAGLPTTFGFAEHRDFIAKEDAEAVQRLKAAGVVLLGKTNVPPALSDLQSNNPVYGRTNNAVDPARVAGGSSGGSAVALGAGMVPLEFGSDIGGSIRVPAAFNGVWGHKPTWGVVPTEGHYFPGTDSARTVLSVIGPMARDGDDLEAALQVVADHPLAPATQHEPGRWRVLLLASHPMATVQRAITQALETLGRNLAAAGAQVDTGSALLPDLERQHDGYWRMLNIAMSRRAPLPEGQEPPALEAWHHLHDEQARIQRQWRRLFRQYDAVIAPTVGMTAFAHDDEPLATRRLDIDGTDTQFFHQFAFPGLATFPMLPATSVPIGRDADGLPIGVQVIADLYADRTAIAAARAAHSLSWSDAA
ncbi:amidase [Sphingomonas sp. Leaf412]|uniref:amidase family protein n=1 Tax=Sphingomonas sp. Leaf412 TaxID=1736370 RepID=UPI0006F632E0|nr:amidase family protein [Sphingomonas sp. Leaf412]KQT33577.1 amidase [Sphingomonas sp. Leaf412]